MKPIQNCDRLPSVGHGLWSLAQCLLALAEAVLDVLKLQGVQSDRTTRLGLRTRVLYAQEPVFAGFPGYHPPYDPPWGSWQQYELDVMTLDVRRPGARS